MKEILLVFVGGGTGSLARFMVGKMLKPWQTIFPFATLVSNFLSCLVFGAVIFFATAKMGVTDSVKLLVLTGFCGGFSTYSSFTFETVELFKAGDHGLALTNIIINFVLSVLGLYLGILVAKLF